MVGLSAHERAQLRTLLTIRRLLSIRRFKGRPQEAFLTIVFLVFALPTPILLATFSYAGYHRLSAPWNAELVGAILVTLWLLWLLAPVFGISLNETPDMSRYLTLPVRRRVMIAATFAGSIFDYSTYFTLPFLIAIVLGGWGAGAMVVVVFAVFLAAAHFVAFGQLITAVTGGLVRSRRFRDLLTVMGGTIALLYWWSRLRTIGHEPGAKTYLLKLMENDVHPLHVLQWTPVGACARAIERASAGHPWEAVAWLAGSLGVLVAVTTVWWRALDRIATQGEFALGSARRQRARSKAADVESPRIPLLHPAVIAIAGMDLRQTWRHPRRRMQVVNGLLAPVIFSFLWFGRARMAGPVVALVPAMFVGATSLFIFQNVMAVDGLAVATLFLSPLDRREIFRGKVLAFAAITAVPVVLLCVFVLMRTSAVLAISGLLLAAATFMVVAVVTSGISARLAVPVPEDRRTGPVRANSAAGWAMSLGQPVLAAVMLAPFWIPTAIGVVKGEPRLVVGGAVAGLAYATLVFHFGIRNAGSALIRREPEIFKMLDPKLT